MAGWLQRGAPPVTCRPIEDTDSDEPDDQNRHYAQLDPWDVYFCRVCHDEIDPRMLTVAWYVTDAELDKRARMVHERCYLGLHSALPGARPSFKRVKAPIIKDRQRYIPGFSD